MCGSILRYRTVVPYSISHHVIFDIVIIYVWSFLGIIVHTQLSPCAEDRSCYNAANANYPTGMTGCNRQTISPYDARLICCTCREIGAGELCLTLLFEEAGRCASSAPTIHPFGTEQVRRITWNDFQRERPCFEHAVDLSFVDPCC